LKELIEKFSIERVHSGGAKFDFEKAKWFNHEWIKKLPAENYKEEVKAAFADKGLEITDDDYFQKVLDLVKDRCTLLADFYEHSSFFFKSPSEYDINAIRVKWTDHKRTFFEAFSKSLAGVSSWNAAGLENLFKQLAEQNNIKAGELQLPLRIMLVGGKFGPPVFNIAEVLGKEETIDRVDRALSAFRF
jgi:glutamyl-tRNA synthetase